ncbi:hypothetical protein ACQKEK_00790 [Pseudomonas sp. NPDC077408]
MTNDQTVAIKVKFWQSDMDRFTAINTDNTGRRMNSVASVLSELFQDYLIANELRLELKRHAIEEGRNRTD